MTYTVCEKWKKIWAGPSPPSLIWTKSKRTASFFRETCPYPSHILFVFASIVWPFDYIFAQPGATWSHPGGHLQSLLVISSNFTFPSPWVLQNVYSGNHYSTGLDLFTPEKFNFIPLLSSLPGLAGCEQRLTIILFYSSELSSIILFHYHQLMLLNLLMLLLMFVMVLEKKGCYS